jgi:formate/nitrite transporter FocA (FNT family)
MTATSEQLPEGREPDDDEIVGQEPETIAARAAQVGRERLGRSVVDILITAFIGGIEVSLGALVAMLVLGAATAAVPRLGLYGGLVLAGAAFPAAFVFVVLGRSELFTENFLVPVVSVAGVRHGRRLLARLWAFSWIGNLAGCALMAPLLSVPDAVGAPILAGYAEYTSYKLTLPLPGLAISAVLAGMLMTVMTWLLFAVRHPVGRLLIIWIAGYALFATNLSHVIVSASVVLVGAHAAHLGPGEVVRYLAVTTLGNLVGGVGLVTLFRVAQVKEKQRQRSAREA